MESYFSVLSLLILFSSFVLMASKRIKSYIKTLRLQSMFVALAIGGMGIKSILEEGHFDILVICIIIIILKVVYLPNLLYKMYENIDHKMEKDFFFNIPMLILVCCALVVFSYFSTSTISGINAGPINAEVVNSISLILIGMFFMISRKKAIGQIVGFLVIENGIFITALFSTHGMPFIIDIGMLMDLITAVVIMGIMVFKINEKFASIDINKLKRLRG